MYCCIGKLWPSCIRPSAAVNHVDVDVDIIDKDMNSIMPSLSPSKFKYKFEDVDKILQYASYENTKPFIPPVRRGKVVKVYDGDTITVASHIPIEGELTNIYRFPVRLHGIDTAELKSKSAAEKELAKKSRDLMHGLVYGKMVDLENVSTEKYGRLLADVYVTSGETRIHVNQWMLDHGHAKKYDGGTKDGFTV